MVARGVSADVMLLCLNHKLLYLQCCIQHDGNMHMHGEVASTRINPRTRIFAKKYLLVAVVRSFLNVDWFTPFVGHSFLQYSHFIDIMLFSSLSLLLASALTHVSAQNVHYHAPEVVAKVEQMMEEFHKCSSFQLQSIWLSSFQKCQGLWCERSKSFHLYKRLTLTIRQDGVSDDTAAINAAISSGNRCAPGSCSSSTTQPAVVYFPAGTYSVSSSIIDYYYTQIIGNPNCLPILKATSGFSSGSNIGIIDADPYQSSGNLAWGSTNVFYRQIRNLIIDTTAVPANSALAGIHWPTAQATSIQNVRFDMGQGSQHVGLFIESGSAGFLNDLTFNGGTIGLNVGNQQYTMRNLIFNNVGTAINQIWDWGWTYSGIQINNCGVGIAMDGKDGNGNQNVGSVTFLDSTISNTPIGVKTSRSSTSGPPSGGSLIIENVNLNNVPTAVQGSDGVLLAGTTGSTTIAAWGQGHSYAPNGPSTFQNTINGNNRPAGLLSGSSYYARSKPGYESIPLSGFISARSAGAKGDGHTDDTQALQQAINDAQSQGKVLYVDHGDYVVTSTLTIPAGSKIVGESYSVIMSSGSFFNDINNPKPVVKIGNANEAGSIECKSITRVLTMKLISDRV
ncbi:hypothetical protein MRB53_040258 [Persea americana]|nr:hypothetical protein MRB53_040258 [Persea americana]